MNTENTTCPLCEHHCDLTAPGCGRGRAYARGHEREQKTETPALESTPADRTLELFMGCAHQFHHRGGQNGRGKILSILKRRGDTNQRELQELTGVRSASVSELLMKAEEQGLVERHPSESDRRILTISLTPSGVAAAESFDMASGSRSAELFAVLSDEERKNLDVILEKLLAHWQAVFSDETDGERPFGRGRHRRCGAAGEGTRAEYTGRGRHRGEGDHGAGDHGDERGRRRGRGR